GAPGRRNQCCPEIPGTVPPWSGGRGTPGPPPAGFGPPGKGRRQPPPPPPDRPGSYPAFHCRKGKQNQGSSYLPLPPAFLFENSSLKLMYLPPVSSRITAAS